MTETDAFNPIAIDLAGVHSIDASAGTGKTYTIATLFLRYIVERGIPIEQVLVTTFTEAATAELRDRLRQRLQTALLLAKLPRQDWQADDGELKPGAETVSREKKLGEDFRLLEGAGAWGEDGKPTPRIQHRLEAALAAFDKASIFTIHGFCNQILTQMVFETRSSFDAEMVDTLDPLIEQAVDDYLARHWCDEASELTRRIPLDKTLRGEMVKVAKAAIDNPDCKVVPSRNDLMDLSSSQLDELSEGVVRPKFEAAVEELSELWDKEKESLVQCLVEAKADGVFRLGKYGQATINKGAGFIDQLVVDPSPELFAVKKERGVYVTGASQRAFMQSEILKAAKEEKQTDVPTRAVFDLMDRLFQLAVECKLEPEQIRANVLGHLASEAKRVVARKKQEQGVLSYADMLHLVDRAIARDPEGELVKQLRTQFPVVLVDEFQDTDPVQYRIFSRAFQAAASEAGTTRAFVMIGDPKQSIYRFRGADLNCYLAATETPGVQRHTMGVNWRSDRTLVKGVQALLGPEAFGTTHLPLPAVDAHHDDRLEGLSAIELHVVPGRNQSLNKKVAFQQVLRQMVDDVVAQLNDPPTILKPNGKARSVGPGDLAILCRAGWQLREIQRALSSRRVPTVLCTEQSVFDTPEAEDLNRVMVALTRPGDRRAAVTALATPVFGLNAEDLEALTADDGAMLGDWLRRLHAWRALWNDRGFMYMWQTLLREVDTGPRLAGQVNGERALTNLRHLGELVQGKCSADHLGPVEITDWLSRALDDADRREHAAEQMQIRLESDADAVQLSTIHKSKGLEYPIVYCPTLWDTREFPKKLPHHVVARADVAGKPVNPVLLDTGTAKMKGLLEADFQQQKDEERRLLYVALTRACHACRIYWTCTESAHNSSLGEISGVPSFSNRGNDAPTVEQRNKALRDYLETWINGLTHQGQSIDGIVLKDHTGEKKSESALDFAPTKPDSKELMCPHLDNVPVTSFITTSFSSLASAIVAGPHRNAELEADELQVADRDSLAETATADSTARGAKARLADMPGGRRVGDLVHGVLEAALTDRSLSGKEQGDIETHVKNLLKPHIARVNTGKTDWLDYLSTALAHCLTSTLPDVDEECTLLQVPAEDLAPEVGFMLGAGDDAHAFDPSELAVALRDSECQTVRDYAATFHGIDRGNMVGFLGGFIDLVFRWKNRWYLLDYKTNKLGLTLDAYGSEGVAQAMIHHHYVLQYHLYAVALHRLLQQRIPGYQYDIHFGGCAYLFIRGMDPGGPPGNGAYFDRPSSTLIKRLSAIVGGPEVTT